MTQNAATMAMKISVVWTMGSGMPIAATAGPRLGGGHRSKGAGHGDAAAGVGRATAVAQRCETSLVLPFLREDGRSQPQKAAKSRRVLASVFTRR